MSAAAGAQPPNQPPGGDPTNNPPPDKPNFNSWTLNTKIKTCKCTVCDGRVSNSSQKCDGCGRHVCSDCLDPASGKELWYKEAARNRMEVGCWACNWRSNMNPAFASRKPAPEVRTEEEHRAKEWKRRGTQRKGVKLPSSKTNGSRADSKEDTSSSGPLTSAGDRNSVIEHQNFRSFEVTGRRITATRTGIKRKHSTEEDSDDGLFTHADVEIALEKTEKRIKRKHHEENSGDNKIHTSGPATTLAETQLEDTLSSAPYSSLSSPPAHHLEGGCTVIVGAGVVGLFVARELALQCAHDAIKHAIVVIDIRDNICELASGRCAGILGTSGMNEAWSPIAELARGCWHQLVSSNGEVSDQLCFNPKTVYIVEDSGSSGQDAAPSWFHGPPQSSLVDDTESFGRIDPHGLATWLYRQCIDLGVAFRFNHLVYDIDFVGPLGSTDVYVEIARVQSDKIRCLNLVLAAGPFTTGIFNSLFDHSPVKLENNVQRSHWFHVPLDEVDRKDNAVIRVPHDAKDIEKLESEIQMVVLPPGRTLTVSGTMATGFTDDLSPGNALNDGKGMTSDLRCVAAKYLNREGVDVRDKKRFPGKGRSDLSTGNNGNPIVDRVPASGLGRTCYEEEDQQPFGVWLCYGFGRYGTTLAPGAAKLLVSRMLYGAGGIDNYDFSVPEYARAKVVSKGKGKAKA